MLEGKTPAPESTSCIHQFGAGGQDPSSCPAFLFWCILSSPGHKDGGVRPIAVGWSLRRLAAKSAGNCVMETMRAYLAPLQLGYGTPHGSEAAVHAARIYLQNLPNDHLLLKLDFKNAFNCLRRDRMLTVVGEKVPELLPLVHSAYSSPSHLFIGNEIIQSSEGVQQGDPLGPLLFCLTIHSIVSQLRSELWIFYMDDGTLGGSLDDVVDDLHTVRKAAENLGLHLNLTKSEIISVDSHTREQC